MSAARPRDPGLQPERTALAWKRTALAMAVNAVLVLRTGLEDQTRPLLLAGVGVAVFALALLAIGAVRRRQLAQAGPKAPAPGLMALTSLAVLLAALCGLWSILQ